MATLKILSLTYTSLKSFSCGKKHTYRKVFFLHTQKRLQMECQLLTWSIAVVQVQELKACAKATPLLEDLEAGAVVQVLVLVLLYKWKRK